MNRDAAVTAMTLADVATGHDLHETRRPQHRDQQDLPGIAMSTRTYAAAP
jgi:hypothetical protein